MIRYYYDASGSILARMTFNVRRVNFIAESYENSVDYIDHNILFDITQHRVDPDTKTLVQIQSE